MSKKAARTVNDWGSRGRRRRRRVRPHVLRAARLAFLLALLGIPACVYLFHSLFHMAAGTQFDPSWANWNRVRSDRSAGTGGRWRPGQRRAPFPARAHREWFSLFRRAGCGV